MKNKPKIYRIIKRGDLTIFVERVRLSSALKIKLDKAKSQSREELS